MTFLTTLTGIFDFANLIFQTGIFSQFKLGKNETGYSNWRMSKIPKIPVQIDRRFALKRLNQEKIKLDISNRQMSKIPKIPVQIDRRFT